MSLTFEASGLIPGPPVEFQVDDHFDSDGELEVMIQGPSAELYGYLSVDQVRALAEHLELVLARHGATPI